MIKKLLSYFKKPEAKISYDFSFGGHTFKVLDPQTMPKLRQNAIFASDYEREWGMVKKDILDYLNLVSVTADFPKEWGNDQDLIYQIEMKLRNCSSMVETLSSLLKEDFQFKPFLKSACHMILLDDENVNELDGKYYTRKMELCQLHSEVEVFFSQVANFFFNSSKGSVNTSNLWEFYPSPKIRHTENKVLKEIASTIYWTGQ